MILNVTMVGDQELIARLDDMPVAVHAALLKKVTFLALKLESYIKKNKLSGQVLNRVSGRLMRSIHNKVNQTAQAVWGRVFSTGDVPYAAIHEFGGKTAPHLIVPKKAAVLAWATGEGKRFALRVNHPGSTMPERSYMRSSLRDMSAEISLGLKEAVVKAAIDQSEGR